MAMGFELFNKAFKMVGGTGKTILASIGGVAAISTFGIATGWWNINEWIPTITAVLFGMFLIAEGTLRLVMPKTLPKAIGMIGAFVGLVAIIAAVLSLFSVATPIVVAQIASVAIFFVIAQFFV